METSQQSANKSLFFGIVILGVLIGTAIAFWLVPGEKAQEPAQTVKQAVPEVVEPVIPEVESVQIDPVPEVVEQPPAIPEEIEEIPPMQPAIELPTLDQSDKIVQTKLAAMTWRQELLKLVIDDDMIRRFVVFTDNFANGNVLYEHSPLVSPDSSFTAIESSSDLWLWDANSSKRFDLYLELLQTLDAEQLVNWYFEFKPLVDEAYGELGYGDSDFTETLKAAIERVINMQTPNGEIELERPSVMFKFKDQSMEKLSEADKLLLRIGKSNLLVLKSLLIKIDEQLDKKS